MFGEGYANMTGKITAPVCGIDAGPIWCGKFQPVRITVSDGKKADMSAANLAWLLFVSFHQIHIFIGLMHCFFNTLLPADRSSMTYR